MKKYIIPLSIVAATFAASCSSDENVNESNKIKDFPIELSLTGDGINTNVTSTKTRSGFSGETSLVMRMKAEKWSYGENGDKTIDNNSTKYTKASTTAAAEGDKKYSTMAFANKYWDDAFGRYTYLSIFAVAVPNKSNISQLQLNGNETNWVTEETPNNKINWTVTSGETAQTSNTIDNEDLVYSRNIQDGAKSKGLKQGVRRYKDGNYPSFDGENFNVLTYGRMGFTLFYDNIKDGPGKFDFGNLHFTHALSRITLKIYIDRSKGFTDNDVNSIENAKLINMNVKGDLNVAEGTYSNVTTGDVKMVNYTVGVDETMQGSTTKPDAKFMAQVLPDYEIKESDANTNMLQFNVGDNVYYVTQKSVWDAIHNNVNVETGTNIKLAQNKNYVLNITVGKTEISNITATLANWDEINGSHSTNNSLYEFTFKTLSNTEGSACRDFNLYRIVDNVKEGKNWNSGYSKDKATLVETESNPNVWKATNWYFNSNQSYYHFRSTSTSTDEHFIKSEGEDNKKDYFEIKAGTENTCDLHWGAPLKSDALLKYDISKGYEDNINTAIGSTDSKIDIIEFHMTSNVIVKLSTTSGDDKVTIEEATVKILNSQQSGKVYMGNGLVEPTGTTSDLTLHSGDNNTYSAFCIPQALDGTDKVKLEITTTDKNVYTVVLSDINLSGSDTEKIKRWLPNHKYTYSLKLSKTGINQLTCTLLNWEDVTGNNQDVTIED